MRNSSIFSRLLAFVIDILLLMLFVCLLLIAIIAGYSLSGTPFSAAQTSLLVFFFVCGSFFTFIFYFTYLTMEGNETVGKRFFQIKVVRPDGTGLSAGRAFIRCIFYPVSLSFWFVSLLIALFSDGCMIHDIISGSRVIKAEP